MTDSELIAKFIRERGVTVCPPALCAPTTVDLPAAAVAVHEGRGIDPMGDIYRKQPPKRGWAAYWARKRAANGR